MSFRAPVFELVRKRQVELNFSITVPALGHRTVVAGPITYPFRVVLAKMVFTLDANNLVNYMWFTSGNSAAPTTGPPSDTNIFGRENPTAFFTGDGFIKNVNADVEFDEPGLYIKLYTYNGNAAAYVANGSIVIQEL